MQKKTACIFGHNNIFITNALYKSIEEYVKYLIEEENVRNFLFSPMSRFDKLCQKVITSLKEDFPDIKRIAYTSYFQRCLLEKDINILNRLNDNFYRKFSEGMLFDERKTYEPKTESKKNISFLARNRSMIDDSDFCIFYYMKSYKPEINYLPFDAGMNETFKYANECNKKITNFAGPVDF